MDKGGTQTNWPENKEMNDDTQDFILKSWQTMCQEKKEKEDSSSLELEKMQQFSDAKTIQKRKTDYKSLQQQYLQN